MEKSFKEKQAHLKELFNNFNEDQLNNLFSPENVVSAAYDSAFRQTLSNLAERHASGSEMDDYFKSIFIEKKIDTAKHLNVELTEKETMVDEVNTAYNTKQINKYLANENPAGVFEAKKFAKTSLSLIKNNGKEDINYVTINGEGKEENSFTLKPGETGILAQNDYGAEKVNAWKIDLDSARKLYGNDAINSLTVQNIENELNDSKIKNLEHSEFSKIATSQMIQITADIISQLNLRVNGDRGIQFNSKDGKTNIIDENAYIVNYTDGEIYPLSRKDFKQTYEKVKPLDIANNINQSKHNEDTPKEIVAELDKYNPLDIANTRRSQGILNVKLDEVFKNVISSSIGFPIALDNQDSAIKEEELITEIKERLKKEVEISTKVQDTSPAKINTKDLLPEF